MNVFRISGISLVVLSLFFIFLGILNRTINFGILVVFPFMYGYGIYAAIAFLLLFSGILLFFMSFFFDSQKYENYEIENKNPDIGNGKKIEYGGIILIGPIPIVFGNNERNVKILVILGIVLMIIVLIIMLLSLHP
ncbi:MAG: TIGR00304 family membrane protein [Thermoplasmata archaeon]